MVRVPTSRRLTAAAALLALLLSPWGSAQACDHADTGEPPSAADGAVDPMSGVSHSCHGDGVSSVGQEEVAQSLAEGVPLSGFRITDVQDSETEMGCCTGECCGSPGVPMDPSLFASVSALILGQSISSPSDLVTGDPAGVFRPPIV